VEAGRQHRSSSSVSLSLQYESWVISRAGSGSTSTANPLAARSGKLATPTVRSEHLRASHPLSREPVKPRESRMCSSLRPAACCPPLPSPAPTRSPIRRVPPPPLPGLLPVGSPCWTTSCSQTIPSLCCRYRPSHMRRLNRPDRSAAGRYRRRSPTPPHQPSSASPPLNSTKKESSSPDHSDRHHRVLKGVAFCSFHKTGLPTDLHFLLLPAPVTASLS
jgi:hypothetical protein